jgi:hypothetical protein
LFLFELFFFLFSVFEVFPYPAIGKTKFDRGKMEKRFFGRMSIDREVNKAHSEIESYIRTSFFAFGFPFQHFIFASLKLSNPGKYPQTESVA